MWRRSALILLLSCFAHGQNPASPLWQRYLAASHEARDAQPWKIDRDLIAIVPGEKGLVWKKAPDGAPMVKVVTWVEYVSAADPPLYLIGSLTTDSTYNDSTLIWVTAAPALKTFCENFAEEAKNTPLNLRIQQVLGLPPVDVARSTFTEFWVRPTDLIRPTPDPEISDHEAELDFPISEEIVKLNDRYKTWFLEHKRTVYTRSVPGTWTRLGYTFDWGKPEPHIGQSEFIIRPGAQIDVDSIMPTEEYCH
jgi:hypothetical protein